MKAGDANLEELEQMLREKALKSLKEAKQLLADDDNKWLNFAQSSCFTAAFDAAWPDVNHDVKDWNSSRLLDVNYFSSFVINKINKLHKLLLECSIKIHPSTYRRPVKSNMFRSERHLRAYVATQNVLMVI